MIDDQNCHRMNVAGTFPGCADVRIVILVVSILDRDAGGSP